MSKSSKKSKRTKSTPSTKSAPSSTKQKRVAARSQASEKKLEKKVASLREDLGRAEARLTKAKDRADRWKKEAKNHRRAALVAAPSSATEPTPAEPAPVAPDESWTVAELKVEARSRGLAGTSRMPKAELLETLR